MLRAFLFPPSQRIILVFRLSRPPVDAFGRQPYSVNVNYRKENKAEKDKSPEPARRCRNGNRNQYEKKQLANLSPFGRMFLKVSKEDCSDSGDGAHYGNFKP